MYSSIECKGIIGNDSRHYVLDLLRMFPPDLNYLPGKMIFFYLRNEIKNFYSTNFKKNLNQNQMKNFLANFVINYAV